MKGNKARAEKIRVRARKAGPGETRIEALLNGKTVSWLTVIHLKMRIGTAQVSMGGIGGVGTDYRFRRRGYSRMCLDQSIETMRELGLVTSTLFGIPDYYTKWGFASMFPDYTLTVSTRAAEESGPRPGLRVEKFDHARHTGEISDIYQANNRSRSASLVRPGPVIRHGLREWVPFQMGSVWDMPTDAFVVLDQEGTMQGYAVHDDRPDAMTVVEAGYADPDVLPAIVAELARRAVEKRVGHLTFHLPIDHALSAYLHRFNSQHHIAYSKNGNAMARIIRLHETIQACAPDLAERSKRNPSRIKVFPLGIRTDIGSVTLRPAGKAIKVSRGLAARNVLAIPQSGLIQLLLGYRGLEDLVAAREAQLPASLLPALDRLFPTGFPYMWKTDRF